MSEKVLKSVYSDLRSNQRRAIAALLAGGNKDEAAQAAGVTHRTIDRWHQEPEFRAALEEATGEAISDVARLMIGGMKRAAAVMLAMVDDDAIPPTVRLRASIALVEHGPRLLEAHNLGKRVTVLEERLRLK